VCYLRLENPFNALVNIVEALKVLLRKFPLPVRLRRHAITRRHMQVSSALLQTFPSIPCGVAALLASVMSPPTRHTAPENIATGMKP